MSTGARRERVVVTHVAGRIGDHNDRAMAASPRLAAALARRYDVEPVVIGSPRPALSVGWQVELDAARDELEALAAHYEALWAGSAVPVTALSRCAGALATLPVVAANRPDALVVWFDAHADLNFPESTPSGYLGGLALSGPLGLWDSGLGAGLGTDHVVLAGVRDIDPPEADLIEGAGIPLVGPGEGFAERLGRVVDGRPVYIHIDCDVLEPGVVPTDYLVGGGLSLAELRQAAEVLARGEVVGIQIGELETATGEEDLDPLLDALSPVLDAVG